MVETVVVIIVVGLAAFFMGRRGWRTWRSLVGAAKRERRAAGACTGCPGCGGTDAASTSLTIASGGCAEGRTDAAPSTRQPETVPPATPKSAEHAPLSSSNSKTSLRVV